MPVLTILLRKHHTDFLFSHSLNVMDETVKAQISEGQ